MIERENKQTAPTQESPSEKRERLRQEAHDRMVRKLALGVIGGVMCGMMVTVAAVGAIGSKSPKLPDQVTAFKTFEIGPSTNMRSNHAVIKGEDGSNLYASLDETITLKAKRFVTEPDEVNGDWYKVPVDDIKAEDPDFKLRTGIGLPVSKETTTVWVNTQGAPNSVQDPTSTETTPTK
jgi:hypothetical protein